MGSKNCGDGRRRASGARMVGASLLWLGAWVWIQGSAFVWLIMFGVYVLALGLSILVGPAFRTSPAFVEWQARFFRTASWVVLSGFLTIGYVIAYAFFLSVFGLLPRD